jgi:hypothetical protein
MSSSDESKSCQKTNNYKFNQNNQIKKEESDVSHNEIICNFHSHQLHHFSEFSLFFQHNGVHEDLNLTKKETNLVKETLKLMDKRKIQEHLQFEMKMGKIDNASATL